MSLKNAFSRKSSGLRPRGLVGVALAASLLSLAACSSEDDSEGAKDDSGASAAADFEPVSIEHVYGTTEIDEQPERVVTLGWGSADAAIALDVVPVAMPALSYGADENGMMPWTAEALEEKGAEAPTLLTEGEEPPYEEIIKAEPDVILATYSGITEAQYKKLAAIADTVAFPDQAWATPWREVITTTGDALGKSEEAEQLVADIDADVAAAAEEHPEFAGKSIAAIADFGSLYVYTGDDPRVQFLEDLGFTIAPSVDELDSGEDTFFYTLSYEESDKLTSDVLVSYADTEEQAATVRESASTKAMEQSKNDTIAEITGASLVASVSPPTALSLTWGMEDFLTALSEAAGKVS
ncbi:iron-siderophore ABC transporter substrate-binding protein [Nocardioides pacificus]